MHKIYVGCGLTYAPEDFKESIAELKKHLGKKYQVIDFNEPENLSDPEVFDHNSNAAKTCDLLVADCSYPSLGLGFEIATALNNHKPVLGIAKKNAKISRFILGITSHLFSLMRYTSTDEILDAVDKKLAGII